MSPTLSEAELIAHLLTLPVPDRAAALDRACAADPALATRRLELLAAVIPSTKVLPARQAVSVLESALAAAPEDSAGAQIGHYKLLQELGEGGFGTVWMAEQQAPIRRRVALKIIKLGMDTREVIARFEVERQALALMDHPNIARVFDAGATDAGRPYFVMELVRGVPITRYCDENHLAPEARLRLFITVCQAVQHAHQKGVIHRDLKPSNILVTLHDGVPVPKIIDFGIAKATNARLTDKTLFTQFHAFIGTPAYTSPEQMEMSGLDVDTRSDIYSLGVLLYELLVGRPPFDPDALAKSGLDAMRRTVREIDPPRPSIRLGTLPDADRTSVAKQRGTDSMKLSLLLRGDLDWIVMHCLEKDRMRRYETASGLALDVQRHLASEPVSARPPSSAYRLRKFIRRQKLAFAAGASIAGALIAGLITSSTLLVRERAAHARAVTAEQAEGKLRQQAELARAHEEKRVIRAALDLANRNLADGRVADGLAYLVYAARKDPLNPALGPRIASVLASNNFAIPRAAPLDCGSRVLALRFTRDGRSFFAGTEDGTFRVLDAATGDLKRQFQLGREVVPGGWQFAAANDAIAGALFSDNSFGLYDVATGEPLCPPLQIPRPAGLPLDESPVSLSPGGRWAYALSPQSFWLWDVRTGAQVLQRDFAAGTTIGGLDFSPGDDSLAIRVRHTIERWSLPEGRVIAAPVTFRDGVRILSPYAAVRFSPDGSRLAVIDNLSAQVFDSATGQLVRKLPSTLIRGTILPLLVTFPSNDRVFYATYVDCGWWDLTHGEFSATLIPNPLKFAFAADGRRGMALSQDGNFRVFEPDGKVVAEAAWGRNEECRTVLSPDGNQVLMGTAGGLIYRFDIGRGAARPLVLPRTLQPFSMPALFLPQAPARLLSLHRDHAKVLQVASGREIPGGFRYPQPILQPIAIDTHPPARADLKFMVVRVETGGWQAWELGAHGVERIVPLQDAPDTPGFTIFSPRDDWVAISTAQTVRIWHLRTGAPEGPPITPPAGLLPHAGGFSADGKQFGVAVRDGIAVIFNPVTALPSNRLNKSSRRPHGRIAFSVDGTRLSTTNLNGETQLWDAKTGDPVGPSSRLAGTSGSGRFSRDGRWLATWNNETVRLTDSRTGLAVGSLIPSGGKLTHFNTTGTRLGTASRQGEVRVWAVPGGEAVTEPMQMPPYSNLPEFSPDDRFLKAESASFCLWAIPPTLPEGIAPPEWLLELATLCASQVVNDAGQLVPATQTVARLDRLRQQIAALPGNAPLAEWGRWVLDDRPNRPIAPGFTVTPTEAEALAAKLTADLAAEP